MPTQSIKLREDQVQGLTWELIQETEDFRRFRAVYGREADGTPVYAIKTEVLAPADFLESVQQERNDTEGLKWSQGMGSDKNGNMPLVKVGSVPLNVYLRDFAGRTEDKDFKKWWWDQPENQVFRVRKGDL